MYLYFAEYGHLTSTRYSLPTPSGDAHKYPNSSCIIRRHVDGIRFVYKVKCCKALGSYCKPWFNEGAHTSLYSVSESANFILLAVAALQILPNRELDRQ